MPPARLNHSHFWVSEKVNRFMQKIRLRDEIRIENANEVMFVGSGRPLEDAARVAFKSMVNWARAGVTKAADAASTTARRRACRAKRMDILRIWKPDVRRARRLLEASGSSYGTPSRRQVYDRAQRDG